MKTIEEIGAEFVESLEEFTFPLDSYASIRQIDVFVCARRVLQDNFADMIDVNHGDWFKVLNTLQCEFGDAKHRERLGISKVRREAGAIIYTVNEIEQARYLILAGMFKLGVDRQRHANEFRMAHERFLADQVHAPQGANIASTDEIVKSSERAQVEAALKAIEASMVVLRHHAGLA